MNKLTKSEVANWIRNIVPYIEQPVILAPKGCFKETYNISPGRIIEYDTTLILTHSQFFLMTRKSIKNEPSNFYFIS